MERLARRCCADAGLRRSPMQREANAEPIPKGNSIPRVCRQRRHERRATQERNVKAERDTGRATQRNTRVSPNVRTPRT